MAKAVFTSTVTELSDADFRSICWFPPRYLPLARAALNDTIVIHRTGENSGYWGTAWLRQLIVESSQERVLALLAGYTPFHMAIPIAGNGIPLESSLRSRSVVINGRAAAENVRLLPDADFFEILNFNRTSTGDFLQSPSPGCRRKRQLRSTLRSIIPTNCHASANGISV